MSITEQDKREKVWEEWDKARKGRANTWEQHKAWYKTRKEQDKILNRKIESMVTDIRALKRMSDKYVKTRMRMMDVFIRDVVEGDPPSRANQHVYGDIETDVSMYIYCHRGDHQYFNILYGVDVGRANELVESNNLTVESIFNRYGTIRYRGEPVSDELVSVLEAVDCKFNRSQAELHEACISACEALSEAGV